MSDHEASAREPSYGFRGFKTFADDTPRDPDDHAFDDDAPWDDAEPAMATTVMARERPPRRGPLIAGAAAAVLALGIGGAVFLARNDEPRAAHPLPPVLAEDDAPAPAGGQMNVELAKVAPLPIAPAPARADRLQVLSPQAAAPSTRVASVAPSMAIPAASAAPQPALIAPQAPLAPEAPAAPSPRVEMPRAFAVAPTAQDAAASAPAPRAAYDCRDAPSRARVMVCEDRRLAALDQQMKRAYAAALAAGVPEDELRADQADWLDVREDAARYSPGAVADIYRQRIGELRRAANDY